MFILINGRRLIAVIVPALLLLAAAGYGMKELVTKPVQNEDFDFKIYVYGQGTVQGAWAGPLGIAVTGVETRPDNDREKELKVISVLVKNQSSKQVRFDPDISLKDLGGNTYVLHGASQPAVEIAPGEVSQGTVIIDVPRGIKDEDWRLIVSGGPLPELVSLPLRVLKVQSAKPE